LILLQSPGFETDDGRSAARGGDRRSRVFLAFLLLCLYNLPDGLIPRSSHSPYPCFFRFSSDEEMENFHRFHIFFSWKERRSCRAKRKMLILSLFIVGFFLAGLSSAGRRPRPVWPWEATASEGSWSSFLNSIPTCLVWPWLVSWLLGIGESGEKLFGQRLRFPVAHHSGVHADEFPREGETDDPQADGSIPA